MGNENYLMEHEEEALRLKIKTIGKDVEDQALWAGIEPGMRVADLGCGSGKTAYHLHKLIQPDGETIGIDFSEHRIQYAQTHFGGAGLSFIQRDILQPLDDLGRFDFIMVRFLLEYYLAESFKIVENTTKLLNPGGILCLVDLDCNCLRNYGLSQRFDRTIRGIMDHLEQHHNFDPYIGVKLYSYLYDLAYEEINVSVTPYNLIYGHMTEEQKFNWFKKIEIAVKSSGYRFEEYEGGYEEFYKDVETFFSGSRLFMYTPLIACRGRKPIH